MSASSCHAGERGSVAVEVAVLAPALVGWSVVLASIGCGPYDWMYGAGGGVMY